MYGIKRSERKRIVVYWDKKITGLLLLIRAEACQLYYATVDRITL